MTPKSTSVTSFCDVIVSLVRVTVVFMTSPSYELILSPVYWNYSNPMFKASKNDHVIQVSLYDEMDFICPYDETQDAGTDHHEYYIIYQVSKSEYKNCVLYEAREMILSCTSPLRRKRFTLLFDPFQSIPNVPEYRAGSSYYYITTSTGRSEGLTNRDHGACLYFNMKLTIHVCCSSSTSTFGSYPVNNESAGNSVDSVGGLRGSVGLSLHAAPERRTRKNPSSSSSSSSPPSSSSSSSLRPSVNSSSSSSELRAVKTHARHAATHENSWIRFGYEDRSHNGRTFQVVLPNNARRQKKEEEEEEEEKEKEDEEPHRSHGRNSWSQLYNGCAPSTTGIFVSSLVAFVASIAWFV